MKKFMVFTFMAFGLTSAFATSSHAKAKVVTLKTENGPACYVVYKDPVTGNDVYKLVHGGSCALAEFTVPVRNDATDEVLAMEAFNFLSKLPEKP